MGELTANEERLVMSRARVAMEAKNLGLPFRERLRNVARRLDELDCERAELTAMLAEHLDEAKKAGLTT